MGHYEGVEGRTLSASRHSLKMPRTARDYRELLLSGRWFQGLTPGFQEALLDAADRHGVPSALLLDARGKQPETAPLAALAALLI